MIKLLLLVMILVGLWFLLLGLYKSGVKAARWFRTPIVVSVRNPEPRELTAEEVIARDEEAFGRMLDGLVKTHDEVLARVSDGIRRDFTPAAMPCPETDAPHRWGEREQDDVESFGGAVRSYAWHTCVDCGVTSSTDPVKRAVAIENYAAQHQALAILTAAGVPREILGSTLDGVPHHGGMVSPINARSWEE